jgi:hypothetical protein
MPAINGVGIDDFNASFIHYLPGFIELQRKSSFMRNLGLKKMEWEGSQVTEHLHIQQNTGFGFIQDGGKIPVAGKQGYVPATYGRRMMAGSVKITFGQAANAKTTKNAAVKAVDSELKGLMQTITTAETFFGMRDGTGKVASLGSTVSGATFTVTDNPGMILRDGDYEIRDAVAPTTIHVPLVRVGSVATALSSGATVVTPTASLAALGQAATDGLYWCPGGISSYGNALTGLDALIDDATSGTFQGINLATYPEYASIVMDNGGSTQIMSTALIRRMLAALAYRKNSQGEKNMVVVTSTWDGVTFEELFEGNLRTAPETRIGGIMVPTFQSSFGKFSLQTEAFAPFGKMFFVDRNELSMLQQVPFDWVREAGGGVLRASHEVSAYTGIAFGMYDLAIHNRAAMGKITNLSYEAQIAY